jgi:DNA-binding LytR/AlgR family response regulator
VNEHALPPLDRKTADQATHSSSAECMHEADVTFGRRVAERAASRSEPLPRSETSSRPQPARIAIKAKRRILLIDPAHVIAVEARGNCVSLLHTSCSYTLRESISSVEKKLSPHGFVRIHRSALVNLVFVEEIQSCSTGEHVLRVKGGREYTVTRAYRKNLHFLAESWIGTRAW